MHCTALVLVEAPVPLHDARNSPQLGLRGGGVDHRMGFVRKKWMQRISWWAMCFPYKVMLIRVQQGLSLKYGDAFC